MGAIKRDQFHELLSSIPAKGEENPCHAEILYDADFPADLAKRMFAMSLCEMARKFEFVCSPSYKVGATKLPNWVKS